MKGQRNALIELFRFLAGVSIATYHFGWVYIGNPANLVHQYIWVEFFFCLSGYFLAKSQKRCPEREPVPYVASRVKSLYSLFLIAFIINLAVLQFLNHYSFRDILILLWSSKWESLFLLMSGWGNNGIFSGGGAPGYISAMLIASLFLCWMIGRHEKLFSNILGPAMILAFYTRIILQNGNLSAWEIVDGFYALGTLRAMAGMSAGALAYLWLYPIFESEDKRNPWSIIAFKRIYLIFFIFALIALVKLSVWISFVDLILYVPLFAILLAVCDTTPFCVNIPLVQKLASHLGRLSYPIFLIHYTVLSVFCTYRPTGDIKNVRFLFLISTLATGEVMLILQFLLRNLHGKLRKTTPAASK